MFFGEGVREGSLIGYSGMMVECLRLNFSFFIIYAIERKLFKFINVRWKTIRLFCLGGYVFWRLSRMFLKVYYRVKSYFKEAEGGFGMEFCVSKSVTGWSVEGIIGEFYG